MKARDRIRLMNRPAGFTVLAEFLDEFDRGVIPRTPTTEALADAFEHILSDSDADVARAMKLSRGAGERITPRKKPHYMIRQFIVEHLDNDPKRWGAMTRAYDAAESRFGKSRRQLENIWKGYAPIYRAYQRLRENQESIRRALEMLDRQQEQLRRASEELVRQQALIDRFITPAEFQRWQHRSGRALYRLARRRKLTQSK